MPELVPWLIFLHVVAAIVGYGPTFVFPLIGAMGGREPQHGNFATRISLALSDRNTTPIAVVQGLSGLALIWAAEIDPFIPDYRWLLLGIGLYLAAFGFAHFVQRPTVMRVIELTGGATGGPPPSGAPAGPPPGLAEAVAKVKRNGMLLGITLLAIIFLMVTKPGLGF